MSNIRSSATWKKFGFEVCAFFIWLLFIYSCTFFEPSSQSPDAQDLQSRDVPVDYTKNTYIIENLCNSQCIIVGEGGRKNGPLWMYDRLWGPDKTVDVTNDQGRWLLTPSINGSYVIKNLMNGQCLMVGENGVRGGPLWIYDCLWGSETTVDVTNDQARWYLIPSERNSYIIQNVKSGQCIIVGESGRKNGPLWMYDRQWGSDKTVDVTNDQGRWRLIPSRTSGSSSVFLSDLTFGKVFSLVSICSVPRPLILGSDGEYHSPTGEIHPDVIPNPYETGKYLMVWTPYPSEFAEIPCIASSTDKINWTLVEGAPVPLVNIFLGQFHADPDILYDAEFSRFWLYFQVLNPREGVTCNVFNIDQADRIDYNGTTYTGGRWAYMARSASVLKDKVNGRYLMYYDGSKRDRSESWFPGAKLAIGRTISSDGYWWSAENDLNPCIEMPDSSSGLGEVWHPTVRFFDGCYYLVAPATIDGSYNGADIFLWRSIDGVNWKTTLSPIIRCKDLPKDPSDRYGRVAESGYRCSLLFEENTMYLWVSYNINTSDGSDFSCRIALFKSELSIPAPYIVKDFEQGGKVIVSNPRDYY